MAFLYVQHIFCLLLFASSHFLLFACSLRTAPLLLPAVCLQPTRSASSTSCCLLEAYAQRLFYFLLFACSLRAAPLLLPGVVALQAERAVQLRRLVLDVERQRAADDGAKLRLLHPRALTTRPR